MTTTRTDSTLTVEDEGQDSFTIEPCQTPGRVAVTPGARSNCIWLEEEDRRAVAAYLLDGLEPENCASTAPAENPNVDEPIRYELAERLDSGDLTPDQQRRRTALQLARGLLAVPNPDDMRDMADYILTGQRPASDAPDAA